jgi:hypothetical protein
MSVFTSGSIGSAKVMPSLIPSAIAVWYGHARQCGGQRALGARAFQPRTLVLCMVESIFSARRKHEFALAWENSSYYDASYDVVEVSQS